MKLVVTGFELVLAIICIIRRKRTIPIGILDRYNMLEADLYVYILYVIYV